VAEAQEVVTVQVGNEINTLGHIVHTSGVNSQRKIRSVFGKDAESPQSNEIPPLTANKASKVMQEIHQCLECQLVVATKT
jgi:hypothetical protein